MKISHIVEQLESLAKQFRHYYTLGNREPWRLLSERVTNDMPNNWSTEWIERREINNTDTQFWGVSWVWRGEGEWKLTQRTVRQMLSQLPMGRSDLRTLLNFIHEVVIRLNEVKSSTNSFMLVNVFMEWDRDSKVPLFLQAFLSASLRMWLLEEGLDQRAGLDMLKSLFQLMFNASDS